MGGTWTLGYVSLISAVEEKEREREREREREGEKERSG